MNIESSWEEIQQDAQVYFAALLRSERYSLMIGSPLELSFIEGELLRLTEFEERASELLKTKKVYDLHRNGDTPGYYNEIEYLRLEAGYYKTHSVPGGAGLSSMPVELYAKHWLLKEYLKQRKADLELSTDNQDIHVDDLAVLLKAENQFIKGMPMQDVYDHFRKKFVDSKSRNKEPFLTHDQLIIFLKKGFLGHKDTPKLHINVGSRESLATINAFHQFYSIVINDAYPRTTTEKFIELVFDCFDNWTIKQIRDNFKPGRVKTKL